jgi:glycoprotein-N-acetylgalactosamine 3-beta-galactosyltransferase
VKNTWGRRCNRLVFVSSKPDPLLDPIVFQGSEGRQFLWEKTKFSFQYAVEHLYNEAEWFLKADDDA